MPSSIFLPCRQTINIHQHTGFTLVEILIVLGIIAALVAVLFPVFTTAREKARQTTCLSNLHQLGAAFSLYVTDNDEKHVATSNKALGIFSTNQAWAGHIFPYLKTADVLHCPSDSTAETRFPGFPQTAYPVSYALNTNLSLTSSDASLVAPAQTVLAIEVEGNHALITLPQEGGDVAPQCSATTNGVNTTLLDIAAIGSISLETTTFATGYLDNYEWTADPAITQKNQYAGSGRHSNGANYLAADNHAVWLKSNRISAGGNPMASDSPQSGSGCRTFTVGPPTTPCAEGTSVGKHTLTFSVR